MPEAFRYPPLRSIPKTRSRDRLGTPVSFDSLSMLGQQGQPMSFMHTKTQRPVGAKGSLMIQLVSTW